MARCLHLAAEGLGSVAPNPMVGAVLVHGNRIVGEGYHRKYGEAHAEVNCLASVSDTDRKLIPASRMYVSLEPCAHFGKTPPCADRIIREGIREVIVGCRDPFPLVDGKGLEKLAAAGVKTLVGILEQECRELNRRFFCFHLERRPYIILKWAQTADGFIAPQAQEERLRISNAVTDTLVHKWRSEEAGILVGANTVRADDPELSNRHWTGNQPVPVIAVGDRSLPADRRFMRSQKAPIVIRGLDAQGIVDECYRKNVQSILVEGGAKILESFISAGLWDEARVITNGSMRIGQGVTAPVLRNEIPVDSFIQGEDRIGFFRRKFSV